MMRRFVALDHLNLEIQAGEILGYLGPNGAGKTTTFKVLLDLMRPDSGSVTFFGNRHRGQENRHDIGFLPENPYFYSYLTASESLDFHGRLYGMPRHRRQERGALLLAQVGLSHAHDLQLRKFSRGMLQRIGIAQALINDPRLLILDEPMSGLDPMGRKQMRDIILSCRDEGKTVIFSSHILSDVEMMCDRAAIIFKGKLQNVVNVSSFLNREVKHWEISCSGLTGETIRSLQSATVTTITAGEQVLFKCTAEGEARQMLKRLEEQEARIISYTPHRESLEEIFVKSGSRHTV
jgi:ABC-2 type transport system ATP-binding protein